MEGLIMDGGWVEVLVGPMFSGKSEELIRLLRRAQIARQKIQVFKPEVDTRGDAFRVTSHARQEFPAAPLPSAQEILKRTFPETQVLGIDEAQFFDEEIVEVCQALAHRGVRVIAAGLDLDYRGQPFGVMPRLMAVAERVTKLAAVCTVCGGPASRTQRVTHDAALVVVGGEGVYEARCRRHHDIPGP